MKKIIIIAVLLILFTGCSKDNSITITNEVNNDINNNVNEKVSTSKKQILYKFDTSLYKITVELNSSKYNVEKEKLMNNYYAVFVETREFKTPYFEQMREVIPDIDKNFKISGYDAIRLRDNLDNYTLLKIDDSTIIYIIGHSNGFYTLDEIVNDSDYKDLLSNIKITVKKK